MIMMLQFLDISNKSLIFFPLNIANKLTPLPLLLLSSLVKRSGEKKKREVASFLFLGFFLGVLCSQQHKGECSRLCSGTCQAGFKFEIKSMFQNRLLWSFCQNQLKKKSPVIIA